MTVTSPTCSPISDSKFVESILQKQKPLALSMLTEKNKGAAFGSFIDLIQNLGEYLSRYQRDPNNTQYSNCNTVRMAMNSEDFSARLLRESISDPEPLAPNLGSPGEINMTFSTREDSFNSEQWPCLISELVTKRPEKPDLDSTRREKITLQAALQNAIQENADGYVDVGEELKQLEDAALDDYLKNAKKATPTLNESESRLINEMYHHLLTQKTVQDTKVNCVCRRVIFETMLSSTKTYPINLLLTQFYLVSLNGSDGSEETLLSALPQQDKMQTIKLLQESCKAFQSAFAATQKKESGIQQLGLALYLLAHVSPFVSGNREIVALMGAIFFKALKVSEIPNCETLDFYQEMISTPFPNFIERHQNDINNFLSNQQRSSSAPLVIRRPDNFESSDVGFLRNWGVKIVRQLWKRF